MEAQISKTMSFGSFVVLLLRKETRKASRTKDKYRQSEGHQSQDFS